jgi:PAB1-binding protein PBP1
MAHTLNKIEIVSDYKHLQIKELTDTGGYHRKVLTPDMDVSGEVQEIKDRAEELWTDEVKTAWTTFQAKQEAEDELQTKE